VTTVDPTFPLLGIPGTPAPLLRPVIGDYFIPHIPGITLQLQYSDWLIPIVTVVTIILTIVRTPLCWWLLPPPLFIDYGSVIVVQFTLTDYTLLRLDLEDPTTTHCCIVVPHSQLYTYLYCHYYSSTVVT